MLLRCKYLLILNFCSTLQKGPRGDIVRGGGEQRRTGGMDERLDNLLLGMVDCLEPFCRPVPHLDLSNNVISSPTCSSPNCSHQQSGMFIAKISAGRTVREFIGGTMAAPVVYTCIWLVIFGGSGAEFLDIFCLFFRHSFEITPARCETGKGGGWSRTILPQLGHRQVGASLYLQRIGVDRCSHL